MASKTTTLRQQMETELKAHRKKAARIRRALGQMNDGKYALPEELLDLEVREAFFWFYESEKQLHFSYNAKLGKEKSDPLFRSVSSRLLEMAGGDQVLTHANKYSPGRMHQVFNLSDTVKVELSWVDPERTEDPCHKVVVVRNVTVEWCGEGDPPLQEGDVIVREVK